MSHARRRLYSEFTKIIDKYKKEICDLIRDNPNNEEL